MSVGYPLVVAAGSKGGVGTTTVVAGLLRGHGAPVVGVDLTTSHDLSRVLNLRATTLSSLVRHRGRMPALAERALRRRVALVSLDLEGALYVERHLDLLRLLASRRPVVVDGGSAFAQTGRGSLDPYLALATHVLLVIVPDVRAVARGERLLARWEGHRDKVVVVENMSEGPPALSQGVGVPRAARGDLRTLMKGPAGEAMSALAAALLPSPATDGDARPPAQGIIRSWLSNWHR